MFYFLIRLLKQKKIRVIDYTKDEEERLNDNTICKLKNGNYVLGCLLLHTHECILYKDHKQIKTPKREYELLMLFLTSPDYFITHDMIISKFWSANIDCTDKINTSVSRLRKLLLTEPRLEIFNKRGFGFQLLFNEDIGKE